ncbi:MAG: RHS repeat protein [Planctomycetaceae bacterium]|nr:RHS repeat protein [Planctomycetaceae bacterium]
MTVAGATTHVANDANGNMTKVVKPDNWGANFTLIYDAWNRLVQIRMVQRLLLRINTMESITV